MKKGGSKFAHIHKECYEILRLTSKELAFLYILFLTTLVIGIIVIGYILGI